jgi:hypothetical protein
MDCGLMEWIGSNGMSEPRHLSEVVDVIEEAERMQDTRAVVAAPVQHGKTVSEKARPGFLLLIGYVANRPKPRPLPKRVEPNYLAEAQLQPGSHWRKRGGRPKLTPEERRARWEARYLKAETAGATVARLKRLNAERLEIGRGLPLVPGSAAARLDGLPGVNVPAVPAREAGRDGKGDLVSDLDPGALTAAT